MAGATPAQWGRENLGPDSPTPRDRQAGQQRLSPPREELFLLADEPGATFTDDIPLVLTLDSVFIFVWVTSRGTFMTLVVL